MNEGEVEERFDGLLIKVLDVVDNGHAFFGRLANGNTARFSLGDPADLERGDIVLLGENWWYRAPDATWPEDSTVGIIRRRLDDGYAVEVGTTIKVIRGDAAVPIEVGNTVELSEIDGITKVISETPLRFRDAGVEEDLGEYLVQQGGSALGFDSFGGYSHVIERKELIETQLYRKDQLAEIGAQPVRGVIFTGPPGTGKTHLARIIADVSQATFYLVSGPSIVSKWVGDSEETLRCLFDEAANKNAQSSSSTRSTVSPRVVGRIRMGNRNESSRSSSRFWTGSRRAAMS